MTKALNRNSKTSNWIQFGIYKIDPKSSLNSHYLNNSKNLPIRPKPTKLFKKPQLFKQIVIPINDLSIYSINIYLLLL
jgi:hypothetical protein